MLAALNRARHWRLIYGIGKATEEKAPVYHEGFKNFSQFGVIGERINSRM